MHEIRRSDGSAPITKMRPLDDDHIAHRPGGREAETIETRHSWIVAGCALGVLSVSFGAPTITMVALKPIADSFGDARTVPSLCYALAWLGSSVGGLAMGQIAERIGVRWTVIFGAVMIATGLALVEHWPSP